jgi:hypothetical protein
MKVNTTTIKRFQFQIPCHEILISVKQKKSIHAHKIVHTTAITTLGTPIFNKFSVNIRLYVNMMDIFNNLSFTQHIRHLFCTLITLKIQTSQKV